MLEVAIDFEDVHRVRGQGDARGDGPSVMPGEQFANLGLDDVVTAATTGENAELVVHFLRPVETYSGSDAVFGEEIDDVRSQERGVGGEAKIDAHAFAARLFLRVINDMAEEREIHKRLAAKESDMNRLAALRLGKEIIDRRFCGLQIHEFFLALGRGDLVFT